MKLTSIWSQELSYGWYCTAVRGVDIRNNMYINLGAVD